MKSWFALVCLFSSVVCLSAQPAASPSQAAVPPSGVAQATSAQGKASASPAKTNTPQPALARPSASVQQKPTAIVPPQPPKMPLNVVFRPNFITSDITHYAGLGFRLRAEGATQDFLVTPHSVFGPAGELKEQMTPEQIKRVVVAVAGISINDPYSIVISQRYIGPVDARAADDKGSEADMAFFTLVRNPKEPALILDPAPSINGDRVWIYVKYPGTQKVGLEGATIIWQSNGELRYLMDNQTVNLANTQGAPLLSSEGQVVGMHMGNFKGNSGTVFGYACPATSIRKVLESQIPKKEKKSLL